MQSAVTERLFVTRTVIGIALLGVYAVPLFFPPLAVEPPWPRVDAMLLERLFPGVPGWWIAIRLASLGIGAWMLSGTLQIPWGQSEPHGTVVSVREASRLTAAFGLGVAILHLGSSFFVGTLTRSGQAAFVATAFLPGLIVTVAESCRVPFLRSWRVSASIPIALFLVTVGWIVWRTACVWGSPIFASPWDLWTEYEYMLDVVVNSRNALLTQHHVGVSNLRMFFAGMEPFGSTQMPQFRTLQAIGVGWGAWTALAVAWAAHRIVSPRVAVWAAVAVLGAPFTCALTHWAWPVFTWHAALTAVELVLLIEFWKRGSDGILLLLAGTAAIIATQAIIAFWTIPGGLLVLFCMVRRHSTAPITVITGAITVVAMAVPYFQVLDLDEIEVNTPFSAWTYAEALSQEQVGFLPKPEVLELRPPAVDYVMGGALAPFAVPRSVLRGWGDALLDPITGALAGLGIALCLRSGLRANGYGWWVFAALIPQLPMMFTSCYDRVSPFRNIGLTVASALFVAIAVEALARRWQLGPRSLGIAAVGCLATAGFYYQEVVPYTIGASALELTIEATAGVEPGRAVVLKLGGTEVTYVRLALSTFARDTNLVPADYFDRTSLRRSDANGAAVAPIIAWAPALEMDCDIARAVCAEWPDAAIYTIWSKPKTTRAFVSVIEPADDWRPNLPSSRWEKHSCSTFADPFPIDGDHNVCSPGFIEPQALIRKDS